MRFIFLFTGEIRNETKSKTSVFGAPDYVGLLDSSFQTGLMNEWH